MSWLTTLQWSVLVFWLWTALGVIRATSDEFVLDPNSEACRNLTVHEWKQFTECAANTYSVGDTLNLTCTYTVPTNSPTIPDEDIVWFKDGRSLNVTGSHYNSKNGLLLADSGNYSCRHEDRELVSLPVQVGEKPSNVPVATCRCRSRKRFNCSWHGTTDYRLPTIHQMKLTYKHDNLEYKTCTFETKTRTHVFDMGSLTKGYTGVVTTTNCLGHSHSNYFDADPHKPPCELTSLPPRNVKVAALNSSISLVNVTFDLPEEWTARELISTDKFIFWFTQSMIASADWDDRNRKVVKQQEVSRSKGGNETGMFYSLSVSDEAYSMVCVRVALKTVGESEFSEAGCRRTRMASILSYQEYKAQLFAINAFGESDPSNVTITKVVTPNKAPLIIICTLVVLTIICCIMLTICLYSKIKKRVLPKVPEPVYYNDPFMTQLQCTHSIEPEVFDPLNSPPVETSTQIANGDAVTSEPAVRVWSEANGTVTHTDDSRAVTARRYITAAKN
ncbi:hypothetical protein BSL78_13263 [Apostichopus japonicus]|uniref:Ig-like domain-containing protein n=1 Tax=Stichopus japonicus TaxID=307972 RepID=A0A2G8KPI5_STIJA|nr:hypothetical protein BSL78_13263 [Apostichopus japonicus]